MPPTEATPGIRAPIEVILAAEGVQTQAWQETIERAAALSLVQILGRRDPSSASPQAALQEALQAFPQAHAAVALPPRASLDAALALASAGRRGVVQAPLHGALASVTLPPGADLVQIAHGWATLPGQAWFSKTLGARPFRKITLEIRGLLGEPDGDLDEALFHALALVHRWFPRVRVTSARRQGETYADLTLDPGQPRELQLVVRARGQGLEARAESDELVASWRVEGDREVVGIRNRGPLQERASEIPLASVRALRQLVVPEPDLTLTTAQEVARLHQNTLEALSLTSGPGTRSLRQSAHLAATYPRDALAPLGLTGALPPGPSAPVLRSSTPPEPLEFWLFQAGVKPVVFLTLLPEDEERIASLFAGATIERLERRVHVGAQDAWTDRRDLGERRVELYISRSPDLAREAAQLQSEKDPTRGVRRLGDLMGYPRCCVEAFEGQPDRSNNTHNRYASASRTKSAEPWPWELNNLHTMLIPCYPCRYDCPSALALARAALDAMDRTHPGTKQALHDRLARPVLYFDDERQLSFSGRVQGSSVSYREVSVVEHAPEPFRRFAGALSAGDELLWTEDALIVRAKSAEILRLHRTDPGLGWLAPFGG